MVEYCKNCGRVRIVTFCPRCENMFVVYKGREDIICVKCHLTVRLCCCKHRPDTASELLPVRKGPAARPSNPATTTTDDRQ